MLTLERVSYRHIYIYIYIYLRRVQSIRHCRPLASDMMFAGVLIGHVVLQRRRMGVAGLVCLLIFRSLSDMAYGPIWAWHRTITSVDARHILLGQNRPCLGPSFHSP